MFDYDDIEAIDPSAVVRLNFEIDDKVFPVRAPTMRLPGRLGAQAQDTGAQAVRQGALRMFVKQEGMTPEEITSVWEQEWDVKYAKRIRFVTAQKSRLNPREDVVPTHPEVIRLDAVPSILLALAAQLRQRDPTFGRVDEAAADVEEKEAQRLQQGREQEEQKKAQQLEFLKVEFEQGRQRIGGALSRWAAGQSRVPVVGASDDYDDGREDDTDRPAGGFCALCCDCGGDAKGGEPGTGEFEGEYFCRRCWLRRQK